MSGAAAAPFADLALARRLERAEAVSSARYVEARARVFPGRRRLLDRGRGRLRDVRWRRVALDADVRPRHVRGADRPATRRGSRSSSTSAARRRTTRSARSPIPRSSPLLNERGYQPFEFTSVMFRPIAAGEASPRRRDSRRARARWSARTSRSSGRSVARGWRRVTGYGDFMLGIGARQREHGGPALSFVAELDGVAIAVGAMSIWRRRGAAGRREHHPRRRAGGARNWRCSNIAPAATPPSTAATSR